MLRVASVGKFLSRNNTSTTNTIERAYNHEISAIDFPEGDDLLKHGGYVMLLV